jgi:membrane-bound metal-dependent hydrolase YbcI (DUF457 family)
MIVLNGMIGTALLMGALRYWEQEYNLEGARAFLVVIASLAVFALIIPNYTKTVPDPSLSPFQAGLFAVITILFYVVFLTIRPCATGPSSPSPRATAIRRRLRMATGACALTRRGHSAITWSCSSSPFCPSCFCRSTWL